MVSSESFLCLLVTLKQEDEDSYQNVYVSLLSCILFDALQLTPNGSKPWKTRKVWVATALHPCFLGRISFFCANPPSHPPHPHVQLLGFTDYSGIYWFTDKHSM